MSVSEVSVQLGADGEYRGFTIASAVDVAELLTNAGVDISTSRPTEASFAPAMQVVELLGATVRGDFGFFRSYGLAFDDVRGDYVILGVLWSVWEDRTGGWTEPDYSDDFPESRGIWLFRSSEQHLPDGDLNFDEFLTVADIDLLNGAIREGSTETKFDLNLDQLVDKHDRDTWVRDFRKTWYGDANLDGNFDSGDLVLVFTSGEYEDDLVANSTWTTGDWDGDAEFSTADLVLAFQDGGFELGSRNDMTFVPEPTGVGLFTIALVLLRDIHDKRKRPRE
jgi:hypothetical protein